MIIYNVKTNDWDHKLIRKLLIVVINQARLGSFPHKFTYNSGICPLLVTRKNAGSRHICVWFTLQTQKAHIYFIQSIGAVNLHWGQCCHFTLNLLIKKKKSVKKKPDELCFLLISFSCDLTVNPLAEALTFIERLCSEQEGLNLKSSSL